MASTVRLPPLIALIVLLGSMEAHAGLSCLSACTPGQKNNDCCVVNPDFGAACATYIALRNDALANFSKEDFDNCVASSPKCQPKTAGRCTIILGCVEDCRAINPTHIPDAHFRALAFGKDNDSGFECGQPLKGSRLRAAARACLRCDPSTLVTTTTTSSSSSSSTSTSSTTITSTSSTTVAGQSTITSTTETPTTTEAPPTTAGERPRFIRDQCFNPCIMRLQSVKDCYRDCKSKCENDQVALPICQRSCRNASCLAIKAKCTLNERNQSEIDPAYTGCCCNEDAVNDDPDCDSDRPDCRTPELAECETTTTTTSTTTTSSSSTAPQSTTTTTSPQPT
jgi:hypothetical protein